MDLSIIIPTWNNCQRMAVTLDAISRCVLPPELDWELILVNNNSRDDTERTARRFRDKLPLVYLEEPEQGNSRARNRGLSAARGRLVIFADDDVTPCREWIATYWSAHREKGSGFYFGGPLVSEFEADKPDEELLALAPPSVSGLDFGPTGGPPNGRQRFLGGNWACPMEPVRALGGFDARLGLDPSSCKMRVGEEYDLIDRLNEAGLRPWYLPVARVAHYVPRRKCGLDHIANKTEAQGVYLAYSRGELDSRQYGYVKHFLGKNGRLKSWTDPDGLKIAGVPGKLYRKAGVLAARWAASRARGKKGYEEYLALRFCIGVMKGIRQREPT